MTLNEYQEQAMRTCALKDSKDQLDNAVLGLAGESGEVADYYKKVKYHSHPLDQEKIIKELGDIMWYVALAAHSLGVTLDDVARINVKKLEKRYPNGFKPEDSINRVE